MPDNHRQAIVDLALEEPELSPRELAVRYTDDQRYYISSQYTVEELQWQSRV